MSNRRRYIMQDSKPNRPLAKLFQPPSHADFRELEAVQVANTVCKHWPTNYLVLRRQLKRVCSVRSLRNNTHTQLKEFIIKLKFSFNNYKSSLISYRYAMHQVKEFIN